MADRAQQYEHRGRALRTARTYMRKAEHLLHVDLPVDPTYWDVLDEALELADSILRKLDDDFFQTTRGEDFFGLGGVVSVNLSDTAQERVEKIVKVLDGRRASAKRERRAALLEQVEGRTPEEARAYMAKAAQLRAREEGGG